MYSKKVLNHFQKPKHSGKLKDANAVGEEGNMKCGDVMHFFIKIKNNKIINARFQTYGCISAIASSDIICDMIKGKDIEYALALTPKKVLEEMGEVPPLKFHCAVMGLNALKNAIKNYKVKGKIKKNKGDKMKEKQNTVKKITKNTVLSDVLKIKGAEEVLQKYDFPCLGCPMMKMEMESLRIGKVCESYGVDAKKLIDDLNKLTNK
ncbi:iron-sulfur cluster assembly scaffold protein [Candidatus Micrarchaeota archaeon]|jgi:nitrogen fixation NifU-like protein|nr:iron-sulfur cluster assembly scaffold protein [Candidatus Micrarchaeota archaeon]